MKADKFKTIIKWFDKFIVITIYYEFDECNLIKKIKVIDNRDEKYDLTALISNETYNNIYNEVMERVKNEKFD